MTLLDVEGNTCLGQPLQVRPQVAAGDPVGQVGGKAPVTAAVRLAELSDANEVERMHRRCSPQTLFRRYHVPMPRVGLRAVRGMVAPTGGGSLVAVAGDDVVGMAVVAPHEGTVMEAGLLVEDGWQRRGIGSALLHRAARLAVARGATELLCLMQPDNQVLPAMAHGIGLTCWLRASAGTVEMRVPLAGVPALPGPAAVVVPDDEGPVVPAAGALH